MSRRDLTVEDRVKLAEQNPGNFALEQGHWQRVNELSSIAVFIITPLLIASVANYSNHSARMVATYVLTVAIVTASALIFFAMRKEKELSEVDLLRVRRADEALAKLADDEKDTIGFPVMGDDSPPVDNLTKKELVRPAATLSRRELRNRH